MRKNVFSILAVSMIGFGIFVGLTFPFFMVWMGVSKNIALSLLMFLLCVLAGVIVGAINIFLARMIVKKRLKRVSDSMIKVENRLHEMSQSDMEQLCDAQDCYLADDSTDEFGRSAHAFNQLLSAFEQSLSTQNAVRKYNRTLSSELALDSLTEGALSKILAFTKTNFGAVFVMESGKLTLTACEGIKDAESLIDNNHILRALKSKITKVIELPEDIVIDGLLTQVKPRSIIVEPLLYKDAVLGVVILASTTHQPSNINHLDMFSNNLALALNNSLKHSQLQTLVALDPLTGAYNRRFGFVRLSEEYSASVRSSAPLGLLMLDLDHFKLVNDTYGHIAGDKILVSITNKIKVILREHDILVRYGGEEFMAVLPGASTHDIMVVADRIRSLIERSSVPYGDNEMRVTVSVGVVSFPETPINKIEELIKYADEALYLAKANGRNQVALYDENVIHEA
ncbi:MAG: sensor domain-containing diguanylate cyclase [Clostridia bacterium]|jgi:two-component system, cell cycle response regulator|nr:sensor domain-containing diguanylate cyclase [Clostridia bacterium]MBT7121738.1 sensor domain-containing diguanylate cyclase [Clostridia bacterium]